MNAKQNVTIAMLYVVVLVVVAQGYFGVMGETIRRLTGNSKTSKPDPIPSIGSGFTGGSSGGGGNNPNANSGGGSW